MRHEHALAVLAIPTAERLTKELVLSIFSPRHFPYFEESCNEGDNDNDCVCNPRTFCASKNVDGNGVCCSEKDIDSNGMCCARECLEWQDLNGNVHTRKPVPAEGTCIKVGKPMWDGEKSETFCTKKYTSTMMI